jgi:DNA replication protein DnaC
MDQVIPMNCLLCGDRGVIVKEDGAYPCRCVKEKAALKLYKNSRLPVNLQKCTFDNFNFKYYNKTSYALPNQISYYDLARHAFEAAQNFVKRFLTDPATDGLLLTGQVGSGKTFLACCIANAVLHRGKAVLFAVVPDLLDLIRSTYDPGRSNVEISEFDILDQAKQVPLLILDDLGAHNYTEWTRNKIYSIVNYRLNHRLPVIVTSNISPEDLEGYLGERTTSRLLEMCKPFQLLVDMDIRAVQRKEKDYRNQ